MDRKKFLATSAVGVSGLMLPTIANAGHRMNSRFARTLHLRHDGLVVRARGPIGAEVKRPAYFAVVIMQGHRIGHGMSELYTPHDDTWDAHVEAEHGRFRVGRALAHGVAVMPDDDEVYTYGWSMHVDLVN